MDRNEYKPILDDMRSLTEQGKYKEAAELADTLPWRKIRNVNVMMRIAKAYENVGRLEECKEILELAYDRSPVARMVVYELAMLDIKLGNFEEARVYYEDFVEIAPRDSLRYVIKYRLGKARGIDAATLISILEELKEDDFSEEWVFELAAMYHQAGNATKCIETCDELILWFGDGPYVERALELKMLYQPLSEAQEDKYRQYRQRRDGIVEISRPAANPAAEPERIVIPEVKAPQNRFDTQNLQSEIRKNIEEIISATGSEEINVNMENIKALVETLPILQIDEKQKEEIYQAIPEEETPQINLGERFRELLAEEYDGQMSLMVPEAPPADGRIEGQVTIQDVMDEWEKTQRAAEAALQIAKEQQLAADRARALAEANTIMEKLVEVAPQLEAGVAPEVLMQQEIEKRGKKLSETVKHTGADGIVIPKIDASGEEQGEGLHIPRVDATGGVVSAEQKLLGFATPIPVKAVQWEAPELDKQATAQLPTADKIAVAEELTKMNELLQAEIDKFSEDTVSSEVALEEVTPEIVEEPEAAFEETVFETEAVQEEEIPVESKHETIVLPEIADIELTAPLPQVKEPELEPEAPLQEVPVSYIPPQVAKGILLSEEQRALFKYYWFAQGMESALASALPDTRYRLAAGAPSSKGNLIITGADNAARIGLATAYIKALQEECGLPAGSIGKISGKSLNGKELPKLIQAVAGGTLIIEGASELDEQTAKGLGECLALETSGLFVVLEDDAEGMRRALSLDKTFTSCFTAHINIPAYSQDELVRYAKAYAEDKGFAVDEMGTLALYNRVLLLKKPGHEILITEVAAVMDEVIEKAGRNKFRFKLSSKRRNSDGLRVLVEKDFD